MDGEGDGNGDGVEDLCPCVIGAKARCESRSFSQPIYLAKRWGLYLPPSLYSLPSPPLLYPATNISRAPTPCGKEIRTSCELDLCLPDWWKSSHTRTHTHASGYTFRRLSLEYGNFAIYLINFCLFHIERERRKRYKRVVPNYFICHTHCHCQRDCNLAKIMLTNKNGKRHKRPSSPLTPPSLCFFLFIYLYINVFLPVAPAAHFKLIVAIYSVFYMPEETHMLCILYRYTCIHPDVVYSYIAHSHARD